MSPIPQLTPHRRVLAALLAASAVMFSCATGTEVAEGDSAPRPAGGEVASAEVAPATGAVGERRLVGRSQEECSRIRFFCEPGEEYFADKEGCGCVRVVAAAPPAEPSKEGPPTGVTRTVCLEKDRQAQMCTTQYEPVCGWFDPAKVQCIKAPCASTFGNACEACRDQNVMEWTQGACP